MDAGPGSSGGLTAGHNSVDGLRGGKFSPDVS